MLIALGENRKLINLVKKTKKKIEGLRGATFYCIACGEKVRLKNGSIKIAHFAHVSKKTCTSFSEGETAEHLCLKQALADWCEITGIAYQVEAYLPELNQRPDLLIGKFAIEVQCSPISIAKLAERTNNYLTGGYEPIWICGEKLVPKRKMKEITKQLCYFSPNIGFYLWAIDWLKEELVLRFHIEEQWDRQLHSVIRSWKFNDESLLEIFAFPDRKLFFHQRKHNTQKLVQAYYYDLNKKLTKKDPYILTVQGTLYNKGFHLLQLPYWFYYPGIRLFCCKQSDIFVKQKLLKLVQFYEKEEIYMKNLIILATRELKKMGFCLIDFPNIPENVVIKECLREVFYWLEKCQIIINIKNKWYYNHSIISDVATSLGEHHRYLENKYLISATPIESMIR